MITATSPVGIADQLRERIETCGMSHSQLSKAAGVERTSIVRFVTGERGLTLDAADKLCDYFGLVLTDDEKPRRKKS